MLIKSNIKELISIPNNIALDIQTLNCFLPLRRKYTCRQKPAIPAAAPFKNVRRPAMDASKAILQGGPEHFIPGSQSFDDLGHGVLHDTLHA